MRIPNENIRRILVIKFGGLGDVFLSTIIIESLRTHFPSTKLDYLIRKEGREAIVRDSRVDSVLVFDRDKMTSLSLIQLVRRQRYDVVIDLFGNPRSAIITFLSGAKYKVGLDYGWRKHLYSITGKAQREKLHGAEVNLQALKAMGVPIVRPELHYPLSEADIAHAESVWRTNRWESEFVVGILPAGSWPAKRCEPEKFGEIGAALARKYGAKIMVVWGPTDESDARAVSQLCGEAAILAPRASLSQNLALLSRCTAIVSNDSGPMHLASAFKTPILCLYGPTYPEGPHGTIHEWVRKEGLDCLECNYLHCPIEHPCMRELSAGDVLEKFEDMLKKSGIRTT